MKRQPFDLPKAVNELRDAINALVEPHLEYLDGRLLKTPSIYDQIRNMVAGMQGTSNGHSNRSMPPIWIDAVSVLNEIELTFGRPAYGHIQALGEQDWTPDDGREILRHTRTLTGFVKVITNLLDPPRKMHIAAPCPNCSTTTVKHTDSAGEEVNGPALKIVAGEGCTCQECGHTWPEWAYPLLAQVLGIPAPAGVVA